MRYLLLNKLFPYPKHLSLSDWAKNDGFSIQNGSFLPHGYSPSDELSERKWNKIKPKR